MKNSITFAAIAALAIFTAPASAIPASTPSLLTSAVGYTGPGLALANFAGFLTFSDGPLTVGSGITFWSTDMGSMVGSGDYGLGLNGESNSLIVSTDTPDAIVTFSFSRPVYAFGGGMNYSPGSGTDPTIAAYDSFGGLIASYNLLEFAPISTPGALNAFAFRGIDGGGSGIKSFTMQGSYAIMSGGASTPVPEPATWAMLIAGFGLVGAGMRRRAAVTA